MAMLALNISTEVLNGFSIVEESLNRTTANSGKENKAIFDDFEEQMRKNPAKVRQWFEKATAVKNMSDSLYNYAQSLKRQIVMEADGEDGNPADIKNKDDLEAASQVMLAPGTGQGKKLYDAINSYRENILRFVSDPLQKKIISSNLSTAVPQNENTLGKNWQEYMFEDMPAAAAVTLLSKLQSDIRYAEGEVLHTLVANIGLKDIRVNKLEAFVVPSSTKLFPGDRMTAKMVMAAVDTTQVPEVYVNGRKINGDTYSFNVGGVGEYNFSGYILMHDIAPGLQPEVLCCGSAACSYGCNAVCRPHECAVCRLREPYQRECFQYSAKFCFCVDEWRKHPFYGRGTLYRRAVGCGA